MNNLLSYFGLVDPRIRASEKDLPVKSKISTNKETEIRRPREETVALMKKLTSLRKLMPRNNLSLICDPGFRYDDGENIIMYFLPKKTNLE